MPRQRISPVLGLPTSSDPERSWLYGVAYSGSGKEPQEGSPDAASEPSLPSQAVPALYGPIVAQLSAPSALVGTAVHPLQRVVQVALGAEHGVLLSDAGVAFTWGDNRYGQLGRRACLIEEDGQPFPVMDVVSEEVIQVAAGRHHCLALSATGLIWAWGRNKAGQLGCSDYRDRVAPEQVCEDRSCEPLGSGHGQRITGISAGGNSSVACALSSKIWQWGEISSSFTEHHKRGSDRPSKEKDSAASAVEMCRPFCVFDSNSFRTRMRWQHVSLSETGGRVQLQGAGQDSDRLKDLVESVRQLQDSIKSRRKDLARIESERKQRDEKHRELGLHTEVHDMSHTLAVLEREISAAENDIYLFTENLKSCDLQQAHHRQQLRNLSEQSIDLGEKEDQVTLLLIDARKGSAEWKELTERLNEVKEYIASVQSSKMALLDQRAQTDKEKQRISHALDEKMRHKEEMSKRFQTVKDLNEASITARATSDVLVKFLREQSQEVHDHFERKNQEAEFVPAMKELEADSLFLQKVEGRVKAFADLATTKAGRSTHGAHRAEKMRDILQSLVEMRRSWNSLLSDKWVRDDLDLSSFFKKASKPNAPGSALAITDAWNPGYMLSLGAGATPQDSMGSAI